MFGGLAFMVDEKMVACVSGGGGALLVRVSRSRDAEYLEVPGARRAEMGKGRSMGEGGSPSMRRRSRTTGICTSGSTPSWSTTPRRRQGVDRADRATRPEPVRQITPCEPAPTTLHDALHHLTVIPVRP